MKKRFLAIFLCLAILCSLMPSVLAVGPTASSYSPNLTIKLSQDGEPYALALVTLIDQNGTIYTTEGTEQDDTFWCYHPVDSIPDGTYGVYENGYLAKEITISSSGSLSELEIPCFSFRFNTHENGAANGTLLTATYTPFEGAEAQTVINYSTLPAGGTVTVTATPAGADTYSLKWGYIAEVATPNADGTYTYTNQLNAALQVTCWVTGSYNTQSAENAISVYYPESGTTATKITNPEHGSGEADGLNTNDILPANRINSYAWAMASNTYTGETTDTLTNGKEYLYIGTNRNLYGGVFYSVQDELFEGLAKTYNIDIGTLKKTITQDQLEEIFYIVLDLYFNGKIPQVRYLCGNEFLMAMNTAVETWVGQILRLDPETGTTQIVYTNKQINSNYRSVVKMNNNLYFGSAFGSTNSIIKIDGSGTPNPQFFNNGIGETAREDFDLSLRAGDVYDASENTLIYAGVAGVIKDPNTGLLTISGTDDATNSLPVVFLLKDNGDGTCETQVICDASGEEFNIIQSGTFVSSVYSGGIWDVCMYRGEPYITVLEDYTFSVWHGRKAEPGEEDNGYGWVWEKIWSRDTGEITDSIVYDLGISTLNIDANMTDVTATMCVYNDKLYFGCFNDFAAVYIKTMLSSVSNLLESGSSTYLTDSFFDIYNYMENQASLFYYDGETVTKDTDFANLTDDKNVDYLWRMLVFDDDLYVTSYDAETMQQLVLPLEANRMEYVLDQLGITFDFAYSELMDTIDLLKEQSSLWDSFNLSGLSYFIRPDSTAALLAQFLSDAMKDSSGNPISVSAEELMNNPMFLQFIEEYRAIAVSFENGYIDYEKMVSRVENLLRRFASVTVTDNLTVGDLAQVFDFSGLMLLLRLDTLLETNTEGFDLYVLDGETGRWSTLLDDGFDDPYNYGGRTLAVCDDTLYVGTANPFYGAQVWRIERGEIWENKIIKYHQVASTGDNVITQKESDYEFPFADVRKDSSAYDAIYWAAKNGVAQGTSTHYFNPEGNLTRAQFVTFLWRAAGSPEPNSASNPFTDVDSGSYYAKAVLWAVENGITTGTTATTFSPDKPLTRAQALTFLYRYKNSPAVSVANSFTDVADGSYYRNAVLWAVENGIADGSSATAFCPNQLCTRAQAIEFLYAIFG